MMKTPAAAPPRKRASSTSRTASPGKARAAAPVAKRSLTPEPETIRDAVSRLKRERIISAATQMFYSNGLGNTTLEAVGEQLNVTKPFIYSHFKSKNDLLAEICSRGIRAWLDVLDRVVSSQGGPTHKLRTLAHELMLAVIENQAHIAIYTREEKHLSEDSREGINAMRRDFDRKFCALLDEGVAAGEFSVSDVQITSLAIGGILSWSYVWYRPEGRLSPEQTANTVADLVLALVQAKAA
ncbi:TetR/AcrR family transcriptional regulator [Hydrogenophaga sp. BPS33]|nr:TetR/AcrR family transcriptional regulator [Hydrogenophaga sp. BPS33]